MQKLLLLPVKGGLTLFVPVSDSLSFFSTALIKSTDLIRKHLCMGEMHSGNDSVIFFLVSALAG